MIYKLAHLIETYMLQCMHKTSKPAQDNFMCILIPNYQLVIRIGYEVTISEGYVL